jgi:Family of unknown function (DUF6151)
MNHPLQCRCGTLRGYVSHPQSVNRAVCYCRDCQAFAHFLGPADKTLDERGGTDVIQTLPANVTFTQGLEVLACMRLSPTGLLRWYTTCCNTAVGNTLDSYKVSFVGLVHTCLESTGKSLDDSFGPVRMHVNTKSAKGSVKSGSIATIAGILRFIAMVARARIDGSYKRTPFFSIQEGTPVVRPKVLSRSERENLMNAVRSG